VAERLGEENRLVVWEVASLFFGSGSFLQSLHAEPNFASRFVILIQAIVSSKTGSHREYQTIQFCGETGHSESSHWILENHPISRLINREAKL
jgi:hypothetical protein